MVVSVARWLLDEASSGTGPATVGDDQGSNDLTIDYSSGDAAWTSIGAGNGLDFTAAPGTANTAIAELDDIAGNGNIGSSLDGATTVSLLLVVDIDAGDSTGSRLFAIGTDTGNGDFAVTISDTQMGIRWDVESGGAGSTVFYNIPSGVTVIAVIVDTTEAVNTDRVKVYFDNSLETKISGDISLNVAIDAVNDSTRSASIGNRPSLNRNVDGKVYYAELFTGALTPTEISDSSTALAAGNDANWVSVSTPSITNVNGDDTHTIGETLVINGTDLDSATHFTITNSTVVDSLNTASVTGSQATVNSYFNFKAPFGSVDVVAVYSGGSDGQTITLSPTSGSTYVVTQTPDTDDEGSPWSQVDSAIGVPNSGWQLEYSTVTNSGFQVETISQEGYPIISGGQGTDALLSARFWDITSWSDYASLSILNNAPINPNDLIVNPFLDEVVTTPNQLNINNLTITVVIDEVVTSNLALLSPDDLVVETELESVSTAVPSTLSPDDLIISTALDVAASFLATSMLDIDTDRILFKNF